MSSQYQKNVIQKTQQVLQISWKMLDWYGMDKKPPNRNMENN